MQLTQAIAYRFDLEGERQLNQNSAENEKLAQLFSASDLEMTLNLLQDADRTATIFIGFLFLVSGLLVLLANEQRLVLVNQLVNRIKGEMCLMENPEFPSEKFNGQLVYCCGVSKNEFPLEDPDLGVKVRNCAKIKRIVEMYQWKPFSEDIAACSETALAFERVWSQTPISSQKHPMGFLNPKSFPLQTEEFVSRTVAVGKTII